MSEPSALRVERPDLARSPRPLVPPRAPKRKGSSHLVERSQWVPAKTYEVFAYFTDLASLTLLAPPWFQLRLISPRALDVQEGVEWDYDIALHGVSVRFRARALEWKPSVAFTDEQVAGPFARWVHRRTFRSERGGTRIGDRVEYALPHEPWTLPVQALYVRPLLERMFDHRGRVIARQFRPVQLW